jgi:hypothetical protein
LIQPKGNLFVNNRHSSFNQQVHNPSFFYEIGLLPASYYQTKFITPEITPSGAYQVIVNIDGHFKIHIVDDMIPVYASNLQPLWGM